MAYLDVKGAILLFLFGLAFGTGQTQVIGRLLLCNEPVPVLYEPIICVTSQGDTTRLVTDDQGNFQLTIQNSGFVRFSFRSADYSVLDTTLWMENGRSANVSFCVSMESPSVLSDELIIRGQSVNPGVLTFTRNQYKVMPASFQDPSRILLRQPGFTTSNDGANGIVFRGMSPEMHKWQLFGADILNPNHLSNAGTANDLATSHAGGVNAINGSVMGLYHFESNPAKASYSDAGSGTSNISMADSLRPYTDLNLIGFEAGVGASLGKRKVYASYRYSFVGLLNKLGVDFGNERIGYQDLAGYGDIIHTARHRLRVFTILGESENVHNPISILDTLTRFKDMQDIRFKNRVGVIGGSFSSLIGRFGRFSSTVVYSGRETSRFETSDSLWSASTGLVLNQDHIIREQMLSTHTRFEDLAFGKTSYSVGVRSQYLYQSGKSSYVTLSDRHFSSIYPYAEGVVPFRLIVPFRLSVGLASRISFGMLSHPISLEPYVAAESELSSESVAHFRFRSATSADYSDPLQVGQTFTNRIRSYHGQMGYVYRGTNYFVGGQAFTHYFSNLPSYKITGLENGIFSLANGSSGGYDFIYSPTSILPGQAAPAISYGCEVFGKVTVRKWQIEANLSVMDVSFQSVALEKKWQPTKYSVGQMSNVSVFYQLEKSKGEKLSVFLAGLAFHYRGGFRMQDLVSEMQSGPIGVYDPTSFYHTSFSAYARTDVRFVYKKQSRKKGVIHRWSLDIQNLLNKENDGYFYNDPYLKSLLLQRQLGLVPVLSYRIEFPVITLNH
jgi:hypothetical protein